MESTLNLGAGNITENIMNQPDFNKEINEQKYLKCIVDRYNEMVGHKNELDGYDCPVCKNKEYIAKINEDGEMVQVFCKCHKAREMLRKAQNSGLGNIVKDFSFDKFETPESWQKENKQIALEFCADDTATLFFIGGQCGSGKSHLCTAICAHYIKQDYDTVYMVWAEDSVKLKSLKNEYSLYQELMQKFKEAKVLYIDDFLKVRNGEEPTNADINIAFELLNHRFLSKDKITIISSEKTIMELLQYDEATMSRVYQKAGRYKIDIKPDLNKNYRLKK